MLPLWHLAPHFVQTTGALHIPDPPHILTYMSCTGFRFTSQFRGAGSMSSPQFTLHRWHLTSPLTPRLSLLVAGPPKVSPLIVGSYKVLPRDELNLVILLTVDSCTYFCVACPLSIHVPSFDINDNRPPSQRLTPATNGFCLFFNWLQVFSPILLLVPWLPHVYHVQLPTDHHQMQTDTTFLHRK